MISRDEILEKLKERKVDIQEMQSSQGFKWLLKEVLDPMKVSSEKTVKSPQMHLDGIRVNQGILFCIDKIISFLSEANNMKMEVLQAQADAEYNDLVAREEMERFEEVGDE